jgi:hypothetical protein
MRGFRALGAGILTAALLAGCGPSGSPDPYDPAKMDLKSAGSG